MKKANASLPVDEPGAAQLVLAALGLIDKALDRIKRPAALRGEDLHAVRIAIKRLRAILRLIRPVISKTFFNRENAHLKKASRRLAFSRDTTIARKTIESLSQSAPRRPEAFAAVLAGFKEHAASQTAVEKAMNRTGSDLEQSARRLERLRISRGGWKAVEPALRKVYCQGRRRMAAALENGDDNSYHRWRIRVKALYHQLQMLEPHWPHPVGPMIGRLKKLESKLGANQDIAMVASLLRKTPNAFGGAENVGQVLKCVDKKSRKLKRKTRLLGEAIFAKKEPFKNAKLV